MIVISEKTTLQTVVDAVFPSWLPGFVKSMIMAKLLNKLVEVGGKAVGRLVKKLRTASIEDVRDKAWKIPVSFEHMVPALAMLAEELRTEDHADILVGFADEGCELLTMAANKEIFLESVPHLRFAAFLEANGLTTAAKSRSREATSRFLKAKNRWVTSWDSSQSSIRSVGALLNKVMKTKMTSMPVAKAPITFVKLVGSSYYQIPFTWEVSGFRGEHTAFDAIQLITGVDTKKREKVDKRVEEKEKLRGRMKTPSSLYKNRDVSGFDDSVPSGSIDRGFKVVNKRLHQYEKPLMSYTQSGKRLKTSVSLMPSGGGKTLMITLNFYLNRTDAAALSNMKVTNKKGVKVFVKEAPADNKSIKAALKNVAKTWLSGGVISQGKLDYDTLDTLMSVLKDLKSTFGASDVIKSPDGVVMFVDVLHNVQAGMWTQYIDFDPGRKERRLVVEQVTNSIRALEDKLYAQKEKFIKEYGQKKNWYGKSIATPQDALSYLVGQYGVSGLANKLNYELKAEENSDEEDYSYDQEDVHRWMSVLKSRGRMLKLDDNTRQAILDIAVDRQAEEKREWEADTGEFEEDENDVVLVGMEELQNKLDSLSLELRDNVDNSKLDALHYEAKKIEDMLRAMASNTKDATTERGLHKAIDHLKQLRLNVQPPRIKKGKFLPLIEFIRGKIDGTAALYTSQKGRAAGSFVNQYFTMQVGMNSLNRGNLSEQGVLFISLESK